MGNELLNQELRAAVEYLYDTKAVRQDKDIADATAYNKSTVSSYLSGSLKASKKFEEQFEKVYGLSLKNFKTRPGNESGGGFLSGPIKITAQQYVEQLQADKKELQDVIKSNLTAMMTLLSALHRHDLAFHETMLESLARLEKAKDPKALVAEAYRRDSAMLVEELNKGNLEGVDR